MVVILSLFSILTVVAIRLYRKSVILTFPALIKSDKFSIAIASGCGCVLWDIYFLEFLYLYFYQGMEKFHLIAFLLPSLMFTLLGWLDDLLEFSPYHKLFYQGILAICSLNIFLYLEDISISFVMFMFFVFILVWLVNSINFIDILDGLASGIVILILSTFLIIFKMQAFTTLFVITLFLLFPLVIFFLHNGHHPIVYLGDAGAHLLGSLLFFLALKFYFLTSVKETGNTSLVAIFSFLIFDFLYVCFVRWRQSKSLFMKSNDHLMFHILKKTGSKKITLLIMLAMQLLVCLVSVLLLI